MVTSTHGSQACRRCIGAAGNIMGTRHDGAGEAPVSQPEPVISPDPARADESLSIEELAQRSGFTPRSIREFQPHGMLPPPERKGRVGRYRLEHLDRLRLIERLQ